MDACNDWIKKKGITILLKLMAYILLNGKFTIFIYWWVMSEYDNSNTLTFFTVKLANIFDSIYILWIVVLLIKNLWRSNENFISTWNRCVCLRYIVNTGINWIDSEF